MAQRLCVVQHADDEGLGCMQTWFSAKGFSIDIVRIDKQQPLPALKDFDWLVVMGGPMSVYEQAQYPWLTQEVQWLRDAIAAGKRVLGVCLGGQLIACALGAAVYPNESLEIGWYPIRRSDATATWLPDNARFLSWHGDCFDPPQQARAFASSEVTACQGFYYGKRVWALQFHIEAEAGTVDAFLRAGGGELPQEDFVQNLDQLRSTDHLAASQNIAFALLDEMAAA